MPPCEREGGTREHNAAAREGPAFQNFVGWRYLPYLTLQGCPTSRCHQVLALAKPMPNCFYEHLLLPTAEQSPELHTRPRCFSKASTIVDDRKAFDSWALMMPEPLVLLEGNMGRPSHHLTISPTILPLSKKIRTRYWHRKMGQIPPRWQVHAQTMN